jgi:ATP-dependent protease ClpP protease subunit
VKLQFTNISNQNATILLYKHFGYDNEMGYGIDGSLVANEIHFLNEQYPELKNIDVKINSYGGSVNDGLSICSAILDSKIPVTTWNSGMAYSIAGVVLMCGNTRKMADYATFMMHDASGGTNEQVLELISNSLAKIFERTTNFTIEKCKELMSKETWMSADECMSFGLVDSIVTTDNKRPQMLSKKELYQFYNKFINKKPMLKLTNLLKLSNEASEEAIVEKVEELQLENIRVLSAKDLIEAENESLKAKLKVYEDAELAKEVSEKEAVIENAVKDGKIVAEAKEIWNKSPMKSTDLKNLFDSLKTTPAFVNVLEAAKVVDAKDEKSNWTYSDWERKDPKGLSEIQNSNPVEFARLITTINTTIKSKI